MGGPQVQPERLTAAGKSLEDVAARFLEALTAFRSELEGFGRPWGQDDIGSLIGAAHDEVSAWAFECYGSALEEIAEAGVDLSGMGERYEAIESAIRGQFDGFQQGLGGV